MRDHPLVFRFFFAALLLAACPSCRPGGGETGTAAGGEAPVPALRIYHQEPVPAECAGEYSRISALAKKQAFGEIAKVYPGLLDCLSRSWGEKKDERLCSYHYNFCVARKNSARPGNVLGEIGAGMKTWPESFQHRVLFASELMQLGVTRSTIPEGTEEAVEAVLRPSHHSKLREMRITPASLHVQWAHLLLRLKRTEEGLAHIQRALELRPSFYRARHLKANFLVALQRGKEAVRLTRELIEERPGDGSLQTILLSACLDTGEITEALEIYGRLESAGSSGAPAPGFGLRLKVKIAGGFNKLKRFAEARDVLMDVLLEDPEDSGALHQLATTLRGLGASAASRALIRRSKELHAYFYEKLEAESAARGARLAQHAYNRARALNELDRSGAILEELDEALGRSDQLVDLQLIKADVLLRLGRGELLRKELEEIVLSDQCPDMLRALRARLRAREGDKLGAGRIIASLGHDLESRMKESPRLGAHLLRIARESGDLPEVARLLEFLESLDSVKGGAPEVAMLCRAEAHLREGRRAEAGVLLGNNYRMLEGGDTWAGALRLLAAEPSQAGEDAVVDISDLVDHPELVAEAEGFEIVTANPALEAMVKRAKALIRDRGGILARMRGFGDGDVLGLWRELLELYFESGASRKARETAWYLWHLDPGGLEASLELARALGREEEVLTRLQVVERGLKRTPGNGELTALRKQALLFLGVEDR